MFDQKLIKECQAFVDTYTAVVVDFIAHGATPLQVCQYLRLCPAASVTSKFTLNLVGENSKYRDNFLHVPTQCVAIGLPAGNW